MLARPTKTGLEYFPLDVNFLYDIKVRKIIKPLGPEAIGVLVYLLAEIYKDNGYYISWNDDICFLMSDLTRIDEELIKDVVSKALEVDFFNKDKYKKYNILTSKGIQNRYISATEKRKNTNINDDYIIKNEQISTNEHTQNNSNTKVNSEETGVNVTESTQSKVKESKVKDNIYTASADAHAELKSEIQGRIWAAYPVKKGKIHAMKSIEKLLKGYTEQQVLNAIATYKADVEKQKASGFKELRYKQGDTFFRTGIYDYLDLEGGETIESNRLDQANEGTTGKADKWSNYDFGDKDL
jgi:putative asp-tRNAAsn/glu-tRNAGln amidotransferase B subunit|nr:MAG TPA: protein of unknown function (DUF4373) [Caudoviricetes sp.]